MGGAVTSLLLRTSSEYAYKGDSCWVEGLSASSISDDPGTLRPQSQEDGSGFGNDLSPWAWTRDPIRVITLPDRHRGEGRLFSASPELLGSQGDTSGVFPPAGQSSPAVGERSEGGPSSGYLPSPLCHFLALGFRSPESCPFH